MSASATWVTTALERLRDDSHCPVCGVAVAGSTCWSCGADFRGAAAQELWSASVQAAAALARREQLLAALPRRGIVAGKATAAEEGLRHSGPRGFGPSGFRPSGSGSGRTAVAGTQPLAATSGMPVPPPPMRLPAPSRPGAEPERSTPLQSLLSLAGAGLFATAAIVFSFFTPDLSDAARTAIVGATGALFLVGGVALARRGLRFSAETVAGLALVFAGLAAHGIVAAAPESDRWLLGAGVTAAGSALLLGIAGRARLRIWLWAGAVGLAVAPAMLAGVTGIGDAGMLAVLAVAFLALAEVALLPRIGARFIAAAEPDPVPLALERGSLIVAQAVAVTIVLLVSAGRLLTLTATMPVLALAAVLVCTQALLATRNGGAVAWSIVAGVAGSGAPVLVALSIAPRMGETGFLVACAAGVGLGLVLLVAVAPLPRTARPVAVAGGAVAVLAVALAPGGIFTALAGGSVLARVAGRTALADGPAGELPVDLGWALVVNLVIGAAALGAVAVLARRRSATFRAVFAVLAIVPGSFAVLALGASALLEAPLRVGLLLVAGVSVSLVARVPRRWIGEIARILLLIAAFAAVVLAAFVGAEDPALMPAAGVVTLLSLFALGAALPAGWRFLLVAAGFGYALGVLCSGLTLTGIGGVALLSLTATAGLLAVAAVTAVRAVPGRSWQAMLVVAAAPFAIGVAQVLVERSGWTALPTAAMAVLAALLLGTRREGAVTAVRLLAAAVIVPALAVSVLCLGAQMLATSASPVVLPVIAALVGGVLPCTGAIRRVLADRGVGGIVAAQVQTALEAGALLTGGLAVVLALVREAAGFGTACAVLALLAGGSGSAAATTGRRHLRAVAAIAATGALWAACAAAGVGLAEAYLLPPALAAVAFGIVRALRGGAGAAFVAAGSAGAVIPVLVLIGAGAADASPWRTGVLLAVSWVLAAGGGVLARKLRGGGVLARKLRGGDVLARKRGGGVRHDGDHAGRSIPVAGASAAARSVPTAAPGGSATVRRLRPAVSWLAAASIAAGLAGTVQAILLARGQGLAGLLPAPLAAAALFLTCAGLSAAGGVGMAAGAAALRAVAPLEVVRRSRWLFVPALVATTAGVWPAIQRDWFSIWGMWSLMLVLLAAMALTARRIVRGGFAVAPVWILFALAFVTAVVAWSPRDLRVEWFSLPLGLFLIAAGMQGRFDAPWSLPGRELRPSQAENRNLRPASANAASGEAGPGASGETAPAPSTGLHDWPKGVTGSWALLAPGIVVTMLASVVSTFTDPLTWRAILVMVCALIAILVGATRRLAASFLIGLIVLPIENLFVFAVQIGRGIESMPWWITLAVMGAVLLIIATTAERRAERAPMAARLRDLR
ncbi:SCO7613 C-terminal domain-containing membrane protein [Microbacterium sp. 2MCAF23]|uniref:SCO7613 C-terminal domain-containing membrane protein n=1 Tax=Microbacterium sp. 2MCAF23 TaxID=3232985 RepID=UPI003F95C630